MNYPSLSLSKELIESAFVLPNVSKKSTVNSDIMKCEKCDYKTDNKNYMDNHTRGKHSKAKNYCTKCSFAHVFPSKIKQHYNIVHLGIKRLDYKYRCKIKSCQYYGKDTCEDLEQHSLLFCNQCEYSARRNEDLKNHMKSVHEGIVFPCDQCSYVSKRSKDLRIHVMSKHTTKFFSCKEEDCSYETYSRNLLEKHIEAEHEGIVKYKCENMNCSYSTNERKSLKKHENFAHENGRCRNCQLTFTNKSELGEHMKSRHPNKNDKNLPLGAISKCEYTNCNFATNSRTIFKRHSVVHIICEYCHQTFDHIAVLKTHVKQSHDELGDDKLSTSQHHTVPAEMDNLDEQINSMIELGDNRIIWETGKRRTVICKMCGKEDEKGNLRKHIESVHISGASYPCTMCGKISRSRGGFRTHIWRIHHQKILVKHTKNQI